ncbi:50S ribosomal protein L11 methyltransferase [Flavobacteriaceae bacterium]|nr:50S ribosomal protein L11 methyltransferase [Flavobacteriaceae bacterium]
MDTSTYIAYYFEVEPQIPGVEILIAELGYVGFESFVETPKGVTAYIQKNEFLSTMLEDIQILKNDSFSIRYKFEDIEQVNWNAKWEENFHPILVDNRCAVRAPFHSKSSAQYDIIIEPKMSFGTGHHETTHMMIQFILDSDIQNKTVLDMGCGTGVLAILAEMKEASNIEAIDIDEWCYLNSIENIERNSCHNIKVLKGDASILKAKKFDIIFANINRNILIKDIPIYASCLNPNGLLFLSGFYKNDIPMIQDVCADYSLNLEAQISKNDWVALKFKIN